MGAVAPLPEVEVRWLPPLTKSGGDEVLRLDIAGREVAMTLRIGQLNRQLVEGLQDRALDLLEIAALVYCADAAVSRGGLADQKMGEKWRRRFVATMPVRDLDFWQRESVVQTLEETLMFLSGDRFEFSFSTKDEPDAERSRFFKFGRNSSWKPHRVLMFSGGLDSFAGAVEEIVEQKHRVALVSHASSTKIAPVQKRLISALSKRYGPETCRHIPMTAQLKSRSTAERTHRTRSFLFAVLGSITATAFGLDRVSFHENGVVSLNLPPVGNVVGTRATRTTHPKTLKLFTGLLRLVFENDMRVDNPYFARTKAEVVERISQLGMADQIVETRSCADVHNQTHQYFHCGRCSQCIDRRFAMLSKGLERFDPEDAYRVDLMSDARPNGIDREMALSYVRNAVLFENATPDALIRNFPVVLDAVNHFDSPPDTAMSMIADLLNRHGKAVTSVMRRTLESKSPGEFPEQSLPRLYGEMQSALSLPFVPAPSVDKNENEKPPLTIEIDKTSRLVLIGEHIELKKNATADLLIVLAEEWLRAAGKGLEPLEYPCLKSGDLVEKLGVETDEVVRRRILTARRTIAKRFKSAGLSIDKPQELIENLSWHGYRLAPERVVIRVRHRS
ncbi:7-cyano-7-deazaguanine synthase [Ruegeria profundi]|nr:7-cyano-7-deazaguanine synthase [Ruegeria profundi]